ncbi:MAG: hypothetical protein JO086_02995 [Acidimicrobiia bacterium]|nr:hypothetical protein [Acidimicrobiia bacterium]
MSRFWTHITAAAIAAIVLVAGRAAVASAETTAPAQQAASQTVTVERPEGQIVVSDLSVDSGGKVQLTVTDTRADDPGWTVSVSVSSDGPGARLAWKPSVQHQTPAFTDSDGTSYAQHVDAGPSINARTIGDSGIPSAVLGSAPRGHGLGIAVLAAKLTAVGHLGETPTVTVTIV